MAFAVIPSFRVALPKTILSLLSLLSCIWFRRLSVQNEMLTIENIRHVILLTALLALSNAQGTFRQQSVQTKTRSLKGPAQEPWRCKPKQVSPAKAGAPWLEELITMWECAYAEREQQVFVTEMEQGLSSEIFNGTNNIYGRAISRGDKASVKYIGRFDEVSTPCLTNTVSWETQSRGMWHP